MSIASSAKSMHAAVNRSSCEPPNSGANAMDTGEVLPGVAFHECTGSTTGASCSSRGGRVAPLPAENTGLVNCGVASPKRAPGSDKDGAVAVSSEEEFAATTPKGTGFPTENDGRK